ncbi:NAD(P)-binding domain-containing protein, partial [bacterium]|nr:NAD(P)-binding domain-containing protein [bacterium]
MQEDNLKLEDLLLHSQVDDDTDTINNIAIIGAGVMGQGIGQTIASSGMDVLIVERDKDGLENAKAALAESMDREIKRWAMTNSDKKAILSRIKWETDFKSIGNYDLIIEAVNEDFNTKIEVFKKLDNTAKKNCIFVSNTSTLSLTKIAETTNRPAQVIGLHFLHPVPKIPVVEVVKCLYTSNETVRIVKSFISNIGKTP